jgi:hypothetical protein
VHLVHGVPAAETRPSKYFDFDLHSYLTDSARVTISTLQREADTAFPVNIQACRIADAVSKVALEQSADLVVIGAGRAREVFGRLRTHSYQIIRDAPCPVLSYLPGREATEPKTQDPRPQYGANQRRTTQPTFGQMRIKQHSILFAGEVIFFHLVA